MISMRLNSLPVNYDIKTDICKYDIDNANCYEINLRLFCKTEEKERIINGIIHGLNIAVNPVVLTAKQSGLSFLNEK